MEAENKMVVTRDVGREMCSCYSMDMFSVIQAELFLEICYSAQCLLSTVCNMHLKFIKRVDLLLNILNTKENRTKKTKGTQGHFGGDGYGGVP